MDDMFDLSNWEVPTVRYVEPLSERTKTQWMRSIKNP